MEMLQWWSIIGFGAAGLLVVLLKMQKGFGVSNIRILGLIFVSTLVTLLALHDTGSISSAMGILGAIVVIC